MGLKDENNKAEESAEDPKGQGTLSRKNSHSSLCPTEDDEEDEDKKLELGPMIALKEQFEKDKVFFISHPVFKNYNSTLAMPLCWFTNANYINIIGLYSFNIMYLTYMIYNG